MNPISLVLLRQVLAPNLPRKNPIQIEIAIDMIVIKSGIAHALAIEIVAETSAIEVATGTTAAAEAAAVGGARVLDPVLIRATGATARVPTRESPRKIATHAKFPILLPPCLVLTASANDPRALSLNLQLS